MDEKYEQLKSLLKELFQLDKPDLDFGFYRIMHARAAEIEQFLDNDLLPQIREGFAAYQSSDKSELEKELAKVVGGVEAAGMNPNEAPRVVELKAQLANNSIDLSGLEGEVYHHLYSFFRRYYSDGDFLGLRRYKEGVYAIPYEGEEVKLHWANKDQYYIKTSEYLSDYAFRLNADDSENPMRVHFRLRDAAEGEHGNVKAAEGKNRLFILAKDGPAAEADGELVLNFEYRPATLADWPDEVREGKNKPPAQKDLKASAIGRVLSAKESIDARWIEALGRSHVTASGETADYSRLEAHLSRYVARNTFDYFIHKDLGGFLRRELDFYIKNEVMHLDDIENESAPRVEQYLSKIKVIRGIAKKIIDFLAQLEDFQKKLWLKKKFVVETRYLIALSVIPAEFLEEIAANSSQVEEWLELIAIDQIEGDLASPGYSVPLAIEFLKSQPTLAIDTRHFSPEFVARIVDAIDQLDDCTDALLIRAENFQALRALGPKYSSRIDCIYADPPFNTAASEILYKNEFKHSSWTSMLDDRIRASSRLLAEDSAVCFAIDDAEVNRLVDRLSSEFGEGRRLATVAVRSNPHGRAMATGISLNHEYAVFWANGDGAEVGRLPRNEVKMTRYPHSDADGPFTWINFRKTGADSRRRDRPKSFYPVYVDPDGGIRVPEMEWSDDNGWKALEAPSDAEVVVLPIDPDGTERVWTLGATRARIEATSVLEARVNDGEMQLHRKYRPNAAGALPGTWWDDAKYSATESGTKVINELFGSRELFSYPKSVFLVEDCLRVLGSGTGSLNLDFFGGSGTTGHATINLNRADGGERKFILVEMGDHFESVLVPRIKKVTFAPEWRAGKPKRAATADEAACSPRVVKLVRLESYEDALGNLDLRRSDRQQESLVNAASDAGRTQSEQFVLSYMLGIETRDSQSLLNISSFSDPTSYELKIKQPGSDESTESEADLLETFNWLLGINVEHLAAPITLSAGFERDSEQRLRLDGKLKEDANGAYWFRTVIGTTPDDRKTLVIWRKLTGEPEQDNLVLDEWFKKQGYSTRDFEFEQIYVNGDCNLENLKTPDETWKVRQIEEDFHRLMFEDDAA